MLARRQRFVRGRTISALTLGLGLLAAGHTLTRIHWQPWCEYWYGLVWLGFILTAEGLIDGATGHSMLFDRPREVTRMFLVSACLWWLFEVVNAIFFGSWSYSPSPDVPSWLQIVRSTAFFSTLLPATWEALMLGAWAFRVLPDSFSRRQLGATERRLMVLSLAISSALAVALVAGAFRLLRLPIGLVAAFLSIDAGNALRERPSVLALCLRGRLAVRFVTSVVASNLLLGLVSEMWNHKATPSWKYDATYAGTARIFEMPILGYVGYVALAGVLFAAYHFVRPIPRAAKRAGCDLPSGHPAVLTGLG